MADFNPFSPEAQSKSRSELFGGSTDEEFGFDLEELAKDQRSRLVAGQNRVDATGDRLSNAMNLSRQNEEIGAVILDTLHEDRQAIERSRLKVREIDENMNRARRTLVGISRRVVTNKLMLIAIIIMLILAIILLVYLKWFRIGMPWNSDYRSSCWNPAKC